MRTRNPSAARLSVPRTWMISTRRLRARFSGSDSGRYRGSDEPTPVQVNRARLSMLLLQHGDHAHRALARQLEIVLIPQRLDRLIVGVADDHARGPGPCSSAAVTRSIVAVVRRVDRGAAGREQVAREQRDQRPSAVLLDASARRSLRRPRAAASASGPAPGRRRRRRKFLEADLRQLRVNRIGLRREARIVTGERDREDRERGRADQPPREVPDQRIAPILETAPAERQLGSTPDRAARGSCDTRSCCTCCRCSCPRSWI